MFTAVLIYNMKSLIVRAERRRDRVKKTLSRKASVKEAEFWGNLKNVLKENPVKLCHK